ncbi:MAG: pilus assembly protein TadG-related protein, partial [Litorimonas sp.]
MIRRFFDHTGGNVAGITAVVLMLLMAGTGAAIDVSGASNLRSSYQDMADAAVLAAARSREPNQLAMSAIADSTVATLDTSGTNPTVTTTLSTDQKYLQVTVEGSYSNHFMHMFGRDDVAVTGFAETIIEITENVEIVLVLDTTHSMSRENRMVDLKRAANTFLNTIESVEADDKVRIAVVPFGQYVNVGLSQRNQDWLDVPADWVETFPQVCGMQPGPVTGRSCTPGVTQPRPAQPASPAQPGRAATFGT